jgi:hypothetical protein
MRLHIRVPTLTLPALAITIALAACDVVAPGRDYTLLHQLEANEQRWQERRPTRYSMTMQVTTLVAESPPTVILTVTGHDITSIVLADTGEPYTTTGALPFPTVEGVFDIIRDALNRRVPIIFVTYDPEYGYPTQLQIDYDPRRRDDDVIIIISDFTPLPS